MKTALTRLAGIIVALVCAFGLGGCSAIKLGYSTLPEVAYWWLDGYLDFTDTQTAQVRGDLARLHGWHRAEELPRLADLLARMELAAAGPVTGPQACAFVAEIQTRLNVVAEQAEPAVLGLAASLSAAQLRHLEAKYASNNDTWRRDWIAPAAEARREKRFEQALDRAESIYGRLDEPQREVLRQQLAASIFDPARILTERQRRQQDLLQTLRRFQTPGLAPTASRALMRGYLERAQRSPDPAYRAWQDALLEEGCRTFSALHASTTPAQREQATRRLRAYQRDLRELAARQ